MGRPPKNSPPDAWIENPFLAPTWWQRIWAARVQRGLGLKEAAAKYGMVRYQTLSDWEQGKVESPDIKTFTNACGVLRYPVEAMLSGLSDKRLTPELTYAQQKAFLTEKNASDEARKAVGNWLDSPDGKYQRVSRIYLETLVDVYQAEIDAGTPHEEALVKAVLAATIARGKEDAAALGVVELPKPKPKKPKKRRLVN